MLPAYSFFKKQIVNLKLKDWLRGPLSRHTLMALSTNAGSHLWQLILRFKQGISMWKALSS